MLPDTTSASMGVKRRKLSWSTRVISTRSSGAKACSSSRAVYRPAKPPPTITMRVGVVMAICCLLFPREIGSVHVQHVLTCPPWKGGIAAHRAHLHLAQLVERAKHRHDEG